jgi:hypothetical protein
LRLEDLAAGKYRLLARAYLNSSDDFYNFPNSAYTEAYNPDLAAAEVVNVAVRACQAYLNGNFNLRGTITPDDVRTMSYRMIGRAEASGGWATDTVDKTTGDYDPILSPGQWSSNYLYMHLLRPATHEDGYLSTSFYIYDDSVYPSSDPLTLVDCGETAADTDYAYQFGKVTVNFSIEKAGATMSSPYLRAFNCREHDDQEVLLYRYTSFFASSLQQNLEEGSVTFLAPQAECTDMEAFATVEGSNTSFGKFELEIVGGSDVVIDIGGPSINVTAPAAEQCLAGDEVEVTGTATDDVGVVGVTVNGEAATLDPLGGDGVTETDFSVTISLEKGSNTIKTIATDTSDKTGTDTRTVYNDSGPPTLDWTPADGASTSSDSIEVSGTVSDDVDVTGVTVNGSLVDLVTTGNEGEYTFSTTVSLEAGENMITVVATDGSGCADDTTEVRKVTLSTNTAPVVDAVNLPTDPVSADTHTAILYWGDESQSGASVDDRTATGSHAYLAAGRYLVGCEITDAAGESDSGQSPLELIVFDPSAGFVTGGGWIRSPAGASAGDPLFSRKANFGINAKYKRGAMYPQGSVYFKAQRMKFHSNAFQWLIVSGEIAQIAGTGRINGEGPYRFLMTARDGGRGRQLDGIRMKIWDESEPDNPIYDNQAGKADDSEATTALGGGQVVIHRE